ncbi:protein-tyrosine phosphatase [Lactobacillus pasteurii DSM 23907 = CRBIP 24.76]|nr:protein-tyrosine phosphatase [Lactobacillus pasteurii DSM 23907 = CRBIP 24.76]TDG77947.1 hypothetical protein C5L33_001752 [Lactobacillus pasteurii]
MDFFILEKVIRLMVKPIVLPLRTVRNPRDLGGYIGLDGRKIKAHRLIRSGKVNGISAEDKRVLREYGLNTIIDLRSPMERKNCPDDAIEQVEHFDYSVSNEDNTKGGINDLEKAFKMYRQDQYAGFHLMCQRYRDYVLKEHSQNSMHKILESLVNNRQGATLYHCSEGKDRTGFVTLILLYILGVDLEVIRQDYLYSNLVLSDYRAKRDKQFALEGENDKFRANMRVLGSVSDAFLDTTLITINEEFGGLDAFIRNQLDVSADFQAALQDLYLEKN